MYKLTNSTSVTRLSDGASIPADLANTDYVAFLKWIAAGNTPSSADPIHPNIAILAAIAALEATLTQRVFREAIAIPTVPNPATGRTASQQIIFINAAINVERAKLT